ncbi:death-associated protein kinase 2-like [Nilaparvata lugens]|uniref:death-associated protein kinase 2-like n=1 Tax=Nilaparvata lugens TaxID=108931 RepID=UPI00193D47C4|nr:death-associated protein kinase 2-like [Nilaparvata lugens]
MHNIHLAHLDLKPENVLVVSRLEWLPHIKVIDFGLSQWLDETGADVKTVFGTPEFVAPEVVNYDSLSLATDMWSIGVITYILLSGASPFLGETKQETYSNVVNGTFSFDREYLNQSAKMPKISFVDCSLRIQG